MTSIAAFDGEGNGSTQTGITSSLKTASPPYFARAEKQEPTSKRNMGTSVGVLTFGPRRIIGGFRRRFVSKFGSSRPRARLPTAEILLAFHLGVHHSSDVRAPAIGH